MRIIKISQHRDSVYPFSFNPYPDPEKVCVDLVKTLKHIAYQAKKTENPKLYAISELNYIPELIETIKRGLPYSGLRDSNGASATVETLGLDQITYLFNTKIKEIALSYIRKWTVIPGMDQIRAEIVNIALSAAKWIEGEVAYYQEHRIHMSRL